MVKKNAKAQLKGPFNLRDLPMRRAGLRRLISLVSCAALLIGTSPRPPLAQPLGAGPTIPVVDAAGVQNFNIEQLDALLAPIALYPDELLFQLLMASTFRLQVVDAARWIEDPASKAL
jgi:hypothetical protein